MTTCSEVVGGRANLVGRPAAEIGEMVAPHVDQSYRRRQIAQWIIDRNVTDFADMTNLPIELRQHLDRLFCIEEPEVL